jgi:hypothetical protein
MSDAGQHTTQGSGPGEQPLPRKHTRRPWRIEPGTYAGGGQRLLILGARQRPVGEVFFETARESADSPEPNGNALLAVGPANAVMDVAEAESVNAVALAAFIYEGGLAGLLRSVRALKALGEGLHDGMCCGDPCDRCKALDEAEELLGRFPKMMEVIEKRVDDSRDDAMRGLAAARGETYAGDWSILRDGAELLLQIAVEPGGAGGTESLYVEVVPAEVRAAGGKVFGRQGDGWRDDGGQSFDTLEALAAATSYEVTRYAPVEGGHVYALSAF